MRWKNSDIMRCTAGMDYHYQLVNNLDSFKTFTLKLSEESWYKSLDCGRRYTLDLVLEELLSNTIKYGYDDALPHTIAITFAVGSDHLKLTVADDGHEFDPRGDYGADVTKPLQERKVGGVGLLLIKSLSRGMDYRRESGRNILEIVI